MSDVDTSGSRPAASSCRSQRKKSLMITSPARMSHNVGEMPSSDVTPGFGCTQPHSAERSTP